ncbi:acid-activated periplasmic chaperone HdeB [Rahnella sp. R3(2024)]|uniref:acid-activated periplasmic chaperone HdeB n=1 Tax=Rahnella sp. R3(2024) TaxID=3163550 RepID=UPI0036E9FAA1
MKNLFKSLLSIAVLCASVNIASAKTLSENISENMTCKEFVDTNPKAMTPVAFWMINKNTDFKGGDYVDWHEVDTISVPLLIKICKENPQSKLDKWINDIK